MNKIDFKKYILYFILMSMAGVIVLTGQAIGMKKQFIGAVPGMMLIVALALLCYIVKDVIPKFPLPAYALSTLLGMAISMPYFSISKFFVAEINTVEFLPLCTPLLAFAGISVGDKINDLKKMSWKIIIIAMVVFTTIFFACALIAQLVLKLQGTI